MRAPFALPVVALPLLLTVVAGTVEAGATNGSAIDAQAGGGKRVSGFVIGTAGAVGSGVATAAKSVFGIIPLPSIGSRDPVDTPIHDDLDGLVERRQIRAVVAWSRTDYFLDKGRQRGIAWESIHEFERWLNRRYRRVLRPIHVVVVPVARNELITMLEQGRADIAVAALTITPERTRRIAFTEPVYAGASEVVVSHRLSPLVPDRYALAGDTLFVRPSSSYAASLDALNGSLVAMGLAPVHVRHADEHLEDEDIMELVNTGSVQRTVVDDYKAKLWAPAMTDLRIETATVRENATIAWGLRPGAPQLKALVDEFVRGHRVGTTFGNLMVERYYRGDPMRRPLSGSELQRYGRVIGLFRKYGDRYGFDPLLLTAQGFQESGLDQQARSREGAIGIMQVLPRTGRAMKVGDITQTEPNIHAGVKYLRQLADRYLREEGLDGYNRTLLAFAAYNAGPGNLAKARRLAARRGLDPDIWFDNVERAMGEAIGVEPVRYVANITKYYLAYKLVEQQEVRREEAREALDR
ncbi:MAG: transglycosylase SLT domain-containing protein [Pseudomonadota bacterium]